MSTATLDAPPAPTVFDWFCIPRFATTVRVSWAGSGEPLAEDVEVVRATSAGGPCAPVAVAQPFAGHAFDVTTAFSTTLYYAIRVTRGGWRSALSAPASVRTPSRDCR